MCDMNNLHGEIELLCDELAVLEAKVESIRALALIMEKQSEESKKNERRKA